MIVTRDQAVADYASCYFTGGTVAGEPGLYIYNVRVALGHRGEGLGTQFMRDLMELVGNNQPLALHCRDSLVGWYEKFGFRVVHSNDSIFGNLMVRVNREVVTL